MNFLKSIGFQPRTYGGWHAKVLILGMEKVYSSFDEARNSMNELLHVIPEKAPELIGCKIEAVEGDFNCWTYV